jgi:hypothetical protein
MIFKTKVGQVEIEVKDYITGGEFKKIQELFLAGAEMGESNSLKANDPKVFMKVQDKMLETIVTSVAGERENILQAVEGLRQEDYQEIVNKANDIVNGLSEEKKTK